MAVKAHGPPPSRLPKCWQCETSEEWLSYLIFNQMLPFFKIYFAPMEGEGEAASQLLGCLTVAGSERKAVFVVTVPPVLPRVDDQSILPPFGSSLCYWIHDYPDDRARASFL